MGRTRKVGFGARSRVARMTNQIAGTRSMAGDAAAAARSFDEQLAAAVAGAQSAVSAAEAPEKTEF